MAQAVTNLSPQDRIRRNITMGPSNSSAFNQALSGYQLKGDTLQKKTGLVPVTPKTPTNSTNQIATPPVTRQPDLNSLSSQLNQIQNNLNASVKSGEIQSGTNPVQPTSVQQPTDPYKSLYDALLKASNPSAAQNQYLKQLQKSAEGNQNIANEARAISEKYGNEINRVGQLGAGAVAGDLSTGTNVVGSGNAAIASQSASQRMNALAQAQQAELAGTGQQLTAQQQEANALNNALGGANTQQYQTLSGLGTAGGFAQPVSQPFNTSLVSPLTGGVVAGGLGGYANYNAAEQVMSLISQYPDAGYQYNPSLSPQENLIAAQQAIQSSPTYQKGVYGVPGAQTVAGATQTQTAQQGYNDAFQSYQTLNSQLQNADLLADNLVGIMAKNGINPIGAQFIDQKIKDVKRQFSSAEQQEFDTALKEVQAAYSNLLASGGGVIPTEATEAANTLISPNSTLGAISAAIKQLKLAGDLRVRTQGSRASQYLNQLGGESSGGGFAEEW